MIDFEFARRAANRYLCRLVSLNPESCHSHREEAAVCQAGAGAELLLEERYYFVFTYAYDEKYGKLKGKVLPRKLYNRRNY